MKSGKGATITATAAATTVASSKITETTTKGEQRRPTVECSIRKMISGKKEEEKGGKEITDVTGNIELHQTSATAASIISPSRCAITPVTEVSRCCCLSSRLHATLRLSLPPVLRFAAAASASDNP